MAPHWRNSNFRTIHHSLPCFAFFAVVSTLLGFLWFGPSETVKTTTSFVSLTIEHFVKGSKCDLTCFPDPFRKPGTFVRGSNISDTRWIPFPPQTTPLSPLESSQIDYSGPIPQDVLDLACPQYMKMLSGSNGASEMDWAKNKTVLFIGSSHDRNNVQYFCEELNGTYYSIGGHTAGSCNITTHNLVLAFWFTYGAIDSDEYDWFSQLEPRPLTFEKKIQDVMLPWMTQQGIYNPDLIVETSLFWDDGFLAQLSTHRNDSAHASQPLTYSELAWHRSRVHALVTYTRALYGNKIPIMFRTRHFRESNGWNRIQRIFQLDQNLRAVAQELDVKLFTWGDLLEGVTTFYDGDQHFVRGPVTWLFGDMTLFYLRQATIPGCWTCHDKLR